MPRLCYDEAMEHHTLHITADAAMQGLIQQMLPDADVLIWQDVLYLGPVPGHLRPRALSRLRAMFNAGRGIGRTAQLQRLFRERDGRLQSLESRGQVVLWLDRSVRDRLQLLQILACLPQPGDLDVELWWVDSPVAMQRQTPQELRRSHLHGRRIDAQMQIRLRRLWSAFTAPEPSALAACCHQPGEIDSTWQHTLEWLLHEYPQCQTGVSHTALQLLRMIEARHWISAQQLYSQYLNQSFTHMPAHAFWHLLNEMLLSRCPLIHISCGESLHPQHGLMQRINLSLEGRELLSGRLNWLDHHRLDRWLGGVHLRSDSGWCLDPLSGQLLRFDGTAQAAAH